MIPITHSVDIQRSIQTVFDFVTNFENDKYWWKAANETRKLTAGPVGVGTEFDQISTVLFITLHNRLRVLEYQPPSRVAYRNESPQLPYDLEYLFTSEGNATRFTLAANLDPHGALKWLLPITMNTLHRQLRTYFNGLKVYLETH